MEDKIGDARSTGRLEMQTEFWLESLKGRHLSEVFVTTLTRLCDLPASISSPPLLPILNLLLSLPLLSLSGHSCAPFEASHPVLLVL
jgi:hypothetical protein